MSNEIKTYAVIVDGIVTNTVLWDGNTDPETGGVSPPSGQQWILIENGQAAYIGYPATQDENGVWSFQAPPPPPPPTAEEILAANTAIRNQLLAAAALAIAPLQDAVDLGEATTEESALLTKWKQFRVAVNRVVLTNANPTWPQPPQPGWGAAKSPNESNS